MAYRLDASLKAPRYDKLIANHRTKKVVPRELSEQASPTNGSIDRRAIVRFRFAEPLYDVKQYKQRFLSGHGNITGFCELNDAKLSDYQLTYKGRQLVQDKISRITHDFSTSVGVNGIIPDPAMMNLTAKNKFDRTGFLNTLTEKF